MTSSKKIKIINAFYKFNQDNKTCLIMLKLLIFIMCNYWFVLWEYVNVLFQEHFILISYIKILIKL
jgi:hypothetical protein